MDIDPDLAVDPTLVAHTAGRLLDAGLRLDEQNRDSAGRGFVGPYMFGGLHDQFAAAGGLGDRLSAEVVAAAEDATATVSNLVAVLQGDADRLYRTGFAAQEAQERSITASANAIGAPR